MNVIIILGLLMVSGLIVVSIIHQKQQKEQLRRLQQRRLRLQIEEMNELLTCIEQTVGDKSLAKRINGIVLGLLQTMRKLESSPLPYVETALQKVIAHHQELENPNLQFPVRYTRESDAQINKTQQQLLDTINLLSTLSSQGKLSELELESYDIQLRWAHLMVAVMSYVAKASKCLSISDRATAQAFYQRALHQLMESTHPHPKRLALIREINEMLEGRRDNLSENLISTNNYDEENVDSI